MHCRRTSPPTHPLGLQEAVLVAPLHAGAVENAQGALEELLVQCGLGGGGGEQGEEAEEFDSRGG